MQKLTNKNILIAITGSIAAYKTPDIIRKLQDLGAVVKIILSSGGAKFITKLTITTVTNNEVLTNLWEGKIKHIELAKWADIILIAPASANTIAKISSGSANDLLTNVILASTSKLIIAPAMNKEMFNNSATQQNLLNLQKRGIIIITGCGIQACGDVGIGRMCANDKIVQTVSKQFTSSALTGKKIIITAGATIEKIDAVRYLSNFSSGKQAIAIANSCILQGAKVILVYANITEKLPDKSLNIRVLSADDMHVAVMDNINNCDVFIAVAAVADFKAKNINKEKITKTNTLTLDLVKNVDILSNIAKLKKRPFCVGFAVQTKNIVANAKKKLKQKNIDMIIANTIDAFSADDNEVVIIDKNQQLKILKKNKNKIAEKIVQVIAEKIIT